MEYDKDLVKNALYDAYERLKTTNKPAEINEYRQNIVKFLLTELNAYKKWTPNDYGHYVSANKKYKIESVYWTTRMVISYVT